MAKRNFQPSPTPSKSHKSRPSGQESQGSNQQPTLEQLPLELLLTILSFLSIKDVLRLSGLCRLLSQAVTLHFRSFRSLILSPTHSDSHIASIAQRCPLLTSLDAEHSSLSLEGLLTLTQALRGLRSVTFPFHLTSQIQTYQDPRLAGLIRQLYLRKPLLDSPPSSFAGPEVVPFCPSLRFLCVKGLALTAPLACPEGLEELSLDAVDVQQLPASIPCPFSSQLPFLRRLSLSCCAGFDPAWLSPSFLGCPLLTSLDLCRLELPATFLSAACFPCLTHLRLTSTTIPDPASFGLFLARHGPHLEGLTLTTLTEATVEALGPSFTCPARTLKVESYDNDALSDAHLARLLRGFTQLERLELSDLRNLTHLPLEPRLCASLRLVRLHRLDQFDPSSLEALVASCPGLAELDVDLTDTAQAPHLGFCSASLSRLVLSISCARTITLHACPRLQSVTVRSGYGGDGELSLDLFELQGTCPLLHRISLPDETSCSFAFTSALISSVHRCAPAIRSIQMPFNEHIASLVQSLRLPHVVSHNSHWIANALLKSLNTLFEKEQQLSSLLKERRRHQQRTTSFEGRVSTDGVLSSGKGDHREWFCTNIQLLTEQFTSERCRNVDVMKLLSEDPNLAQEVEMLLHFKRALVVITNSPQDEMLPPFSLSDVVVR